MKKFSPALMIAVVAIVISGLILLPSSSAQARSVIDKIFGDSEDDDQGPPPEKTLQAPFSTDTRKGTSPDANNQLIGIYDSQGGNAEKSSLKLDQPHLSPEQIAEWASGLASQAMTITPQTWESDFTKISGDFTPYAVKEYKDYIAKTNMINILTSNTMKLHAITDGPGIVVKEGAIGGTYHWLIQIPVMTSFYQASMQEVERSTVTRSQNLLIQVQVGRVTPKNNTDVGLVIERWFVSAAAK